MKKALSNQCFFYVVKVLFNFSGIVVVVVEGLTSTTLHHFFTYITIFESPFQNNYPYLFRKTIINIPTFITVVKNQSTIIQLHY
jgi:hypothetical protein